MLPQTLLAGVALMAMACASNSQSIPSAPTAPSPTPAPTPAGERWNFTTTLRAFTGPDECAVYRAHIGESTNWWMAVERSGESIHIVISDPDESNERIEYVGTVVSNTLTATSKNSTEGRVCGGSRVAVGAERLLSGHFSPDGHALAAEEVVSSQLRSGETLTFHFDLTATQQRGSVASVWPIVE